MVFFLCSDSRLGRGVTPAAREGRFTPRGEKSTGVGGSVPPHSPHCSRGKVGVLLPPKFSWKNLKTFPAKYRWTKYMSIKIFGFTKSTFSNILQIKAPVQHNIHENNEYTVRSAQPERMYTFIWFTYDYTDWPLIHSFTLFPPDAFAHWQTIFFLNQSARKNVSSICRNSYAHHLINLPSCHCGVTGRNSTLSKSHVRN